MDVQWSQFASIKGEKDQTAILFNMGDYAHLRSVSSSLKEKYIALLGGKATCISTMVCEATKGVTTPAVKLETFCYRLKKERFT